MSKRRSTKPRSKPQKKAPKKQQKNILQQMGLKKNGGIDRRRKTPMSIARKISRDYEFDVDSLCNNYGSNRTSTKPKKKVDLRRGKKHNILSLYQELTAPNTSAMYKSLGLTKNGRIDKRTKAARKMGLTNYSKSTIIPSLNLLDILAMNESYESNINRNNHNQKVSKFENERKEESPRQDESGNKWSCIMCTFDNHLSSKVCSMCGTPKPNGNKVTHQQHDESKHKKKDRTNKKRKYIEIDRELVDLTEDGAIDLTMEQYEPKEPQQKRRKTNKLTHHEVDDHVNHLNEHDLLQIAIVHID